MASKCEGLVTGHDFSSHLQSIIVSSEGVSTAVTPGYTAVDGRLALKSQFVIFVQGSGLSHQHQGANINYWETERISQRIQDVVLWCQASL